jgi:hypothetical protein
MIVLELEQVEVDYCTSCKGIWLDAVLVLLETLKKQTYHLFKSGCCERKKHDCPICRKQMKKFEIGEKEMLLLIAKNHESGSIMASTERLSLVQ